MVEAKHNLSSAFARWWREQRTTSNFLAVFVRSSTLAWEFLVASLPSRRRQRYGDIDYDWEQRVDTTSATVSWRTRLLGLLNSPYQPIPPEQFREIMAALAIDFPRFTFIDIGSGKGRALLLAAEFGFRRIIGVELLPELDEIARENVRKLKSRGIDAVIEVFCLDAANFEFPSEPTIVFLFNPLPAGALHKLIKNIEESLRRAPRGFYLAYANPLLEYVVANSSKLIRIANTPAYSLFRAS